MGAALYSIIITPLELFIELIFSTIDTLFNNPGIAIIFVSIAVQLLCFPLYKRADDIQEQERQKQKEMERWVTHIKNTFKGDERFMMQQAYYREVGYKPIYAIKGSISLLLQIPFFIAAYNFLSNLTTLEGESFLGISDLSKPDGLIQLGSVSINLLPVLMTFFNIISGVIYTKGFPLKDKIQTYGLAAIFLVILYKSPSGLVFYWTLNNFFSLFKNVILKVVKNTKRFIAIVMGIIGVALPVYFLILNKPTERLCIGIPIFSAVCFIPAIVYAVSCMRKAPAEPKAPKIKDSDINIKLVNSVFYFSCVVLVLLLSLLIPVDVIKSSPVEFKSVSYGPFGLILNAFFIYIGLFFVWINTFYIFSSPGIRRKFSIVLSILSVSGLVNYLFFGKNLGTMSAFFVYDFLPEFRISEIIINILAVAAVSLAVYFLYVKKTELVKRLQQILSVTLAVMIAIGSVSIVQTLKSEGTTERDRALNGEIVTFTKALRLSKNGKNVIVFMLDRAISGYLPFIIEEKPEIKEMFDGFTYYPNTVSFGGCTNFCTPSLFGGYEYTPTEINKRTDETLAEKHNEAISVLPMLFLNNGFRVSVTDIPYANYKWNSDMSMYSKYDGIYASKASGRYSLTTLRKYKDSFEPAQKRNTVFFSIMKSLPVFAQRGIYNGGCYWDSEGFFGSVTPFFDEYTVLQNLSNITSISNDSENTFNMIQNSTTHEPLTFGDDYSLPITDITAGVTYDRFAPGGGKLHFSNVTQTAHYQTNMAALLRVGEWLDYLKEQGVYDNTRIILVADHGRNLSQFGHPAKKVDLQMYNPLLLVKDFNAKGFGSLNEFMTIADTPTLAVSGVIENPVNPFTGRKINNSEKTAHPQIITTSRHWDISNGAADDYEFDTSDGEWWSVEKSIFSKKNWKKVGDGK